MKYQLTEETKTIGPTTLSRIVALKDFGDVTAGDLGGWIEAEKNLSQDGDCWIYDDASVFGEACVYDNAQVYDNAFVYGEACVYGDAEVFGKARVFGEACVYDNAQVYDQARVFGEACVYDNAQVYDQARVFSNSQVYGNAFVYGEACVFGNVFVYGNARVYGIASVSGDAHVNGEASLTSGAHSNNSTFKALGTFGEDNRTITVEAVDGQDNLVINAGCFTCGSSEFKEALDEKYNGQGDYYLAISFVEMLQKNFKKV